VFQASQILSKCYGIKEQDINYVHKEAGSIIPNIITSAAITVGLVGLQIYKLLACPLKEQKLSNIRNFILDGTGVGELFMQKIPAVSGKFFAGQKRRVVEMMLSTTQSQKFENLTLENILQHLQKLDQTILKETQVIYYKQRGGFVWQKDDCYVNDNLLNLPLQTILGSFAKIPPNAKYLKLYGELENGKLYLLKIHL